jgi:hypothetical protein
METIIILLLLIPVVGYILQMMNIGKWKETEVLLPVNSAEIIRSSLVDYTRSHNWSLLLEEPTSERLLYVFKAGQFGFSREGSQKITVTFFPSEKEMRCFIKSESLLGQFYDFNVNQRNIESLSFYLTETLKHPDAPHTNEFTPTFFTSHATVNMKYWLFLLCTLLLIIGIKTLYSLSRTYEPGKVVISFQPYVTDEIADKLMRDFGAINCVNTTKVKFKVYECDTPIGEEKKIAASARTNAVVKSAEPKYTN